MRVFIVGAGTQARLSYRILLAQGHTVPYVFDRDANIRVPWDCVMLNDEKDIAGYAGKCDGFLVCISDTEHNQARLKISRCLESLGIAPVSAIHPTVFIAESARIGRGLQTYPRAIVNEFATVSDYCILGSNCCIDHDGFLGEGVHVMGAAAIAGGVRIGSCSTIATNATVLPNIRIGKNTVVGAGAVVREDVPDNVVVAGNPARIIRDRAADREDR